jgi:hypothetical protein
LKGKSIMKNIRLILALLFILALSIAAMTGCNKGEASPGTTTSDSAVSKTETPTPPATEAATELLNEKVNLTFSIKDQDGNSVTEATVTILPVGGEGESATLTTDGEGSMTVLLPVGQYTVRFDVLPEYVLGIDTTITVTPGMESVTLEVTDNTPNGSEARPFVINEDTLTVTIPAGTTYHFTLFGGYNRTLTVKDANSEITYKTEVYTPNKDGEIAVRIVTDSPRDHAFFALTNKSEEAREITVNILSDPGTMDNPIVIETLGESITANVPQDGMVYYQWTATATGTLTASSTDAINNICINNLITSQVSESSAGGESVSLAVTEGDVITVVVSAIGGDKQAESQPVTFTLSITAE